MDALVQFLVEGLAEHLLFGLGRLVLRAVSLGRIRLDAPTQFQSFVTACVGFVAMIAALGGVVSLVGFLA